MRAIFISSALTLASSSLVFAADLGQYRPGNPYQSVIAPGADVCQNHCTGDAQCKSWNYIKANPNAAGVCEFNANDVAPVASAISISGTNTATVSRPGVVSGGTNTIRVGTQAIQTPRPVAQQTLSGRKIVRQAVPQQRQAQTAVTRRLIQPKQPGSLIEQQNQYRQPTPSSVQPAQPPISQKTPVPQQFKYDLGGQAGSATQPVQRPQSPQGAGYPQAFVPQASQSARPSIQPHRTDRRQFHNQPMTSRDRRRQQRPSGQPREMQSNLPQSMGQPYPPQAQMAAPGRQAYAAQQPMMRRSASEPVTHQNVNITHQGNSQSPANLAQGLSASQAQHSLFGKLNDDVIIPNSTGPVPNDPNAPIPTSASRPTVPVQRAPLDSLAGAPRQ